MRFCARVFLSFFLFAGLTSCNPSGDHLLRKQEAEAGHSAGDQVVLSSDVGPARIFDSGTRSIISAHGSSIRLLASRYDLDWRLVLAVMKAESSFRPDALSHRGARGLMQIMPTTGREVGEALDVDVWSRPVDNIHGGVFYLRRLYDLFGGAEPNERIRLTLAAYNAGIGRIYDARDVALYLREDPNRWESIRDALPLLSKRYYTLHTAVWADQAQPPSGWFSGSNETVEYVGKVMRYYDEYRLMMN